MSRCILYAFLACVVAFIGAHFIANREDVSAQGPDRIVSKASPISGKWSYRSFRSNPDLTAEPNALLFGQGTLDIAVSGQNQVSGTLGGEDWQLKLSGRIESNNPLTIRFQGKGIIDGEEWVYDYLGYLVPVWPNGVDQRPAIVGSIVRTKPHSMGNAPAGYVAQWIAVKQDAAGPGALKMLDIQPKALSPFRELQRNRYLKEAHVSPPIDMTKVKVSPKASLQPETIKSQNGRLDVTLEVRYETVQIGQDPVRLRTYNGKLVGPVLRAKAGDTLHITLDNRLPVEPASPHLPNSHHEWNTTNLHFHGLHVAPQGPANDPDGESDNVLLELKPSSPHDPKISVKKYKVRIPANHPAGTFWYHAHKHGSVTAQVSSGMVGALIIERDDAVTNLDSIPEVGAAQEEILVLQQIPYLRRDLSKPGEIERSPGGTGANEDTMFAPGAWKPLKRYVTVNGLRIPTITMSPGEVRRLRLVASGQRESMRLQLERAPGTTGTGANTLKFYEIAVDGLATGAIRETSSLDLFPGYRSDALVHPPADTSGEFYLVDANAGAGTGADGSPEPLRWVAKVVIAGPSKNMSRPQPAALILQRVPDLDPANVTGTQHAFYGLVFPPQGGVNFFISRQNVAPGQTPTGSEYDPTNPRVLTLGKTERWMIGTRNGSNVGQFHPFHIHTNSFLITKIRNASNIDVTEQELGPGILSVWRDTLAMKQGFTYELLTRYDDFTGSFVQHCHILDHEDNGMMELVRIDDPANPAPAPNALQPRKPASNRITKSIQTRAGSPTILIFVKGATCPHCMAQLRELARDLEKANAAVTVISGSSEEDLKSFPQLPFALLADPTHAQFKRFNVFEGEPRHGTIVLDRAGKERFRKVGDAPFMDTQAVLAVLGKAQPSFVIAVRNTDEATDDYLTWSPTECTIRMINGDPTAGPMTVTLTNDDPLANPNAGELRFATSLLPKKTATLPSITLKLNPDGTPVKFYVAGFKASTLTPSSLLNGGRDTKIVIRQGNETGPQVGEHLVMVRVRKALRHPSDPRSKLTDFELTEVLNAIRDLHLIDNRFEWYVRMHRLATARGSFAHPLFGDPPNPRWRDQAHGGSGFIAWHRAFLLQFERELQVRYPHVALPYWVQGTNQTFFVEDRLGEADTSGDVVRFKTGSPLHGWSISLPMDRGGGLTAPMGLLRRQPLNHNDSTIAFYRQWADFAVMPNIDRFTTIRNVEANPHNNGHGVVGPSLMWMSNCRESNADPVFYLFHCNHDYLWAKWQHELDRYLNDGTDPFHYFPNDAFTDMLANKNIPLGHHLKDTMWPWDGTTGQVVAGFDNSNRPNVNGFGEFPKARLPLLWPPAPAQPKPSDMIDYQGLLASANDLGFCYDDVPFGAKPKGGPGPDVTFAKLKDIHRVAFAVVSNRSTSADTRLLALRSLPIGQGTMTPESLRVLTEITADKKETPEMRTEALRRWFAEAPHDAIRASLGLMADPEAPLSTRLSAMTLATRQMHFSEVPHTESHRVVDQLRALMSDKTSPSLRAVAISHLAHMGDPSAKKGLIASLDSPQAALPLHEAIALLRFFPDEKARLRGFLASPNEQAAVAAIQALFKDAESLDARRKLARDNQQSMRVRKAAVQSLMHDDGGDLTGFLVDLASDSSVELELRKEALAAVSVRLRKSLKTLSVDDRKQWAARLQAIQAADTTDFGRIRRDALSVVAPKR